MKDFVGCYSVPLAEKCITTDQTDYNKIARKEVNAWLNQLKRTFPFTEFCIKIQSHELGDYYEVVIPYDSDSEIATQQAFNVVDELPYNWDYKAKEELGKEYFDHLKEVSTKRID